MASTKKSVEGDQGGIEPGSCGPQDAAKILFLMVDGSRAQEEIAKIEESKLAGFSSYPWAEQLKEILKTFKTALIDGSLMGIQEKFIHKRISLLQYIPVSIKPKSLKMNIDKVANFDDLSKEEEDILNFVEAMEILGYEAPDELKSFMSSIIINNGIPVTPDNGAQSPKKTFFLCAENRLHLKIAGELTADDVYKLWSCAKVKLSTAEKFGLNEAHLKSVSGLKDVAYFYLILKMIELKRLNKIYTHPLSQVLREIQDESNKEKISRIAISLRRYPISSHPPGLCLIFSMNDDRQGAKSDAKKVKEFFGNVLNYDVYPTYNPTQNIFQNVIREISSRKYMYYDSLVVWIMAHGDEDSIHFSGEDMKRKEIIDEIVKIDCFKKKPKIVFLQACEIKRDVQNQIPFTERKMMTNYDAQGMSRSYERRYGKYRNLVTYNERADTLTAHATFWWEKAARNADGSLYVDTVIDQLMKHGTSESIENVLRRVHYNVNQIQLETGSVSWKQTPYFESALQKEFIFSRGALYQDFL